MQRVTKSNELVTKSNVSQTEPTQPTIKIYDCRYCDKKYKHIQTRWSHEQICKEIHKDKETKQNEMAELNNIIETAKKEYKIIKQENEIWKLKDQLLSAKCMINLLKK